MGIIDRILGPRASDAERLRAWDTFGPVTVAGVTAALGLAAVYAAAGWWIAALTSVTAALLFVGVRALGSASHVEASFLISFAGAEIGAAGVGIELGGLASPAAPWIVVPPLVGYLTLGRRVGLVSSLLAAVTVIVVVALARPPPLTPVLLEIVRALSILTLLAATLFIAASQQRVRAESLTRMQEANEALERARDAAEATSRHKSEFVATVSHELRTPMNAIVGMNDLLLRTRLDDAQREYARTAQSAAESLLVLVDDLLEISRLDAGRVSLVAAPCDLAVIAEGVRELLSHRAQARGLSLRVIADRDLPRVVADAARLRQILTNLVDNAVKFTSRGGVIIRVSADPPRDGRVPVRLAVEDSGIGIAPDKLQLIFERFRQADSSTTRRYGGTGLGLAIARDLLALMGGTIHVSSRLNEGSTFTAELELALAADGRYEEAGRDQPDDNASEKAHEKV